MRLVRWAKRVILGWAGVLAGAGLPVGLAWWLDQRLAVRWIASLQGDVICPAALPVTGHLVVIGLAIVVAAKLFWRCIRPGDAPLRDGWRAGWSVWRWLRFLTCLIGAVAAYRQNFAHPSLGQVDPKLFWMLLGAGLVHFAIVVPCAVMLDTARSTRAFLSAYPRIWFGRINRPAAEVLAADLASHRSGVRLAATRLLGERPASETVSAALQLAASDQAANIREEAVEALGRKPEHDGLATLAAALHDPNEAVRHNAADGLRGWDSVAADEALYAAIEDPDEHAREAATFAIRWRDNPRDVAALVAAIADPSALVRRQAYVKFRWRDDTDPAILVPGLSDADARVRQYAAEGVERSTGADPAVYEALLSLLDDPCKAVRNAVPSGLARHGRGQAVPVLRQMLDAPARYEPWRVISALGETGDPAAVRALCLLLDPSLAADYQAETACCGALADLGDPAAIRPLKRYLLRHRPASTAAARAISQIGGQEAASALCDIFDRSRKARESAAYGLLQIEDPTIEEPLRQRLRRMSESCRFQAKLRLKEFARQRQAAARQLSRAPVPAGVNETSLSPAPPQSCGE